MLSYKYNFIPLLLIAASTSAFTIMPTAPSSINHKEASGVVSISQTRPSLQTLQMAGFGGGGGGMGGNKNKKNKKKAAPATLKPKKQWDRYAGYKSATLYKVGVRVVNDKEDNEWLETGKVKTKNDEVAVDMAVMVQRGIIAEHSKRLYPLKVLPKDKVEWGYSAVVKPEQGDWTLIGKDDVKDIPAGTEKIIGFEGKPDSASGFYCHYEGGRLVDRYSGDVVAKEYALRKDRQ